MALADLLDRLKRGESVTAVTAGKPGAVTLQPASLLAVTPVTPVTAENNKSKAKAEEAPLPVTISYFSEQGVWLLRDDLTFLLRYLPVNVEQRNATIRRYIDVWRRACESEPVAHKKANAGRRAANIWLRM